METKVEFTVEQIKDLITFAKTMNIKHFILGDLQILFNDENTMYQGTEMTAEELMFGSKKR